MNSLLQWLETWKGWRTYVAQGAHLLLMAGALCAVIATYFGGITLENGLTLGTVLGVLGQMANAAGAIFQRMATQDVKTNLAELPDDVKTLKSWIDQLQQLLNAKAPPVDPFNSVPNRSDGVGPAATGALLLCLLFTGSALAVQPTAIVQGPKSAEPGEEIILDLSSSEGEPKTYAWRVYPKIQGKKQLTLLEGNKKARLASFPGVYTVTGLVANDDGIDVAEFTVTIPGNPPCPNPPPPAPSPTPVVPTPGPVVPTPTPIVPTPGPVVPNPPNPAPTPDGLPVGEFDSLPSAVLALANTVNSPTRKAEATKLADAFEAIAAQLSAGTLKNPISIVSAIGTAFNGSVPPAWDSAFREKAIEKMKGLYEGGKLPTPDRWAVMLREVNQGLRAVK